MSEQDENMGNNIEKANSEPWIIDSAGVVHLSESRGPDSHTGVVSSIPSKKLKRRLTPTGLYKHLLIFIVFSDLLRARYHLKFCTHPYFCPYAYTAVSLERHYNLDWRCRIELLSYSFYIRLNSSGFLLVVTEIDDINDSKKRKTVVIDSDGEHEVEEFANEEKSLKNKVHSKDGGGDIVSVVPEVFVLGSRKDSSQRVQLENLSGNWLIPEVRWFMAPKEAYLFGDCGGELHNTKQGSNVVFEVTCTRRIGFLIPKKRMLNACVKD